MKKFFVFLLGSLLAVVLAIVIMDKKNPDRAENEDEHSDM